MAIIGTFSKTANGYAGAIRSKTVIVKASFVAIDKNGNRNATESRGMADKKELAAAWPVEPKKENVKPFNRVELDDPSFDTPIGAVLFENSEEVRGSLVRSRHA